MGVGGQEMTSPFPKDRLGQLLHRGPKGAQQAAGRNLHEAARRDQRAEQGRLAKDPPVPFGMREDPLDAPATQGVEDRFQGQVQFVGQL